MIRIVITGGGTGGHLYPALAVAEALKQESDIELLYIGNIKRKEAELIPEANIDFEGLIFSGMPRRLHFGLILWFKELVVAFIKSRSILKSFKPHAVFATGGYVTAPVLLAALSLKIPYVIHEPDAYPGLVNRLMSQWAEEATSAFYEAGKRLKAGTLHVTGNPLRSQIGQVGKQDALVRLNLPFSPEKPILFVTGGSQGARRLNEAVLDALAVMIDQTGIQIIHQTGEKLFEEVKTKCPVTYQHHASYYPVPFINDMASVLAIADIALCRSGSMTLSEMYRAHVPTILVPYPFAAADHQRMNALASQNAGASLMILDDELTGEKLGSVLLKLFNDPAQLESMKKSAKALAKPDATSEIVKIIRSVAQTKLY